MAEPDPDLDCNYAPVCPHCWAANGPDRLDMGDGEETEMNCCQCGESFLVLCSVVARYTTREPEGGAK